MKLRMLAIALALPLVVLAGCAELPAAQPTAPAPRVTTPAQFSVNVSPARNTSDAASIEQLFEAVHLSAEATPLIESDSARKLFPKARFPRKTLDRLLLAMIYGKTQDPKDPNAKQELTLVYEGQLVLAEAVYKNGAPAEPEAPAGSKKVKVGPDTAVFSKYAGQAGERYVRLEWKTDGVNLVLFGLDLTEEQMLEVARSIAP